MQGFLKFLAWVVGIAAGICAILYVGLLDVWTTPTDDAEFVVSIEPTLSGGDTVLFMRHGVPGIPDLVRCDDPDAPGRFVVGRIVGGCRDSISISSESLTVNGSHAPAPRACVTPRITLRNPATDEDEELSCRQQEYAGITFDSVSQADHPEPPRSTVVPDGQVYLLSDNRHMHLDSRDFNALDPHTCKHIVFRLWSRLGWGDSARRFSFIP